jgi:DNA-binding NtrC family response regulator
MSRILVIDDEAAIGWSLRELLGDEGHEVRLAADIPAAIESAGQFRPQAILLDVRLGRRDGIEALPEIRAAAGEVPVVVMTAFGDLDTAVRAVAAGGFDYLVKPFDLERVSTVVARALAERALPAEPPREELAEPPDQAALVGSAPAMQEVFKQVALVAASELPVLITGEAGTGKDLVARAIHAHSGRRERPFVVTNLAALAPGAIESELFGQAPSGPEGGTDRPGLFELAEGGTIFLDQIAEASAEVQIRLLRAVEHGELTRVGEAAARRIDVRVIAATNRNLAEMLAAGRFREDLLHRLSVFPIRMPTLAERPDDIEPLTRHFLARYAASHRTARLPALADGFLDALRGRPWPGNVRELKQAVEYAAVLSRGGTLRPEHLPEPQRQPPPAGASALALAAGRVAAAVKEWSAAARREFAELPEPDLHHRAVQLLEGTLLREALAHTGGNRTAAAKLLGLDRATLRTKLKLLGIDD